MRPPVIAENSIRSENTGVPIIREIMVATTMTMSSLFAALFALLASSFRTCLWRIVMGTDRIGNRAVSGRSER